MHAHQTFANTFPCSSSAPTDRQTEKAALKPLAPPPDVSSSQPPISCHFAFQHLKEQHNQAVINEVFCQPNFRPLLLILSRLQNFSGLASCRGPFTPSQNTWQKGPKTDRVGGSEILRPHPFKLAKNLGSFRLVGQRERCQKSTALAFGQNETFLFFLF